MSETLGNNQNLLSLLGYDVSSVEDLIGQTFKDPAQFTSFLQPAFNLAQTALSALPGQRREQFGELASGLEERGIREGTRLRGAAASTGFDSGGQITQLGEISRTGRGRAVTTGITNIREDINRREASIVGGLSGKIQNFLESLLANEAELASNRPPAALTGPLGAIERNQFDPLDPNFPSGTGVPPITPGTTTGEVSPDGRFEWIGFTWRPIGG